MPATTPTLPTPHACPVCDTEITSDVAVYCSAEHQAQHERDARDLAERAADVTRRPCTPEASQRLSELHDHLARARRAQRHAVVGGDL